MKINKTFYKKTALLLAMLFLMTNSIFAFAVSSKYYEGYPMRLLPGGTEETVITLQNRGGTEDIKIKAEIINGSEVLTIIDSTDIYTILAGGSTKIKIKVSVPNDSSVKDRYNIVLRFGTVTEVGQGTFGLANSIETKFDVVTKEETEGKGYNLKSYLIAGLVIILILIIAGFLIVKKRKKIKK